MVCDRVQRECPGGDFLACGPLAHEQREPSRMQSSWGRTTRPCGRGPPHPCASGADPRADGKECAQHDLLGLSPEGEAALQGMLLATLEIQQKRAKEMHAELLAAFGSMEGRIMSALAGASVRTDWHCQDRSWEVGKGPLLDPKIAEAEGEDEQREAKQQDNRPSWNQQSNKSLMHIDLQSIESGNGSDRQESDGRPSRGLRETCARAVKHPRFYLVVSIFIWASVLLTFVELQYEGYKANVALGFQSPGSWLGAEAWISGLSHVLNVVFAAEVALCVIVWGWPYLKEPWGFFDAALVFMSCLDSYVLQHLGSGSGQDFTVVRLLRCTRLLRTLQVARELKMVQPLHLFMRTISASMSTLLWSLVFLGIFQLIGALFISRSLHDFIMDPANSREDRVWCNRMYGSASKALYTFFEITFSGGWPNYVRPLVEKAGLMYCAFFVFYIAGLVFAVVRIISALFIKETFAQASKDEVSHAQAKINERRAIVKRLKTFFSAADRNESGKVSSEEFVKFFDDPELKNWLEVHEVNLRDPSKIWELVDNGKEELTLNEFVEGMLRIRGPALAQDMQVLLRDSRGVTELLRQMHARLDEVETSLSSFRRQRSGSVRTHNIS